MNPLSFVSFSWVYVSISSNYTCDRTEVIILAVRWYRLAPRCSSLGPLSQLVAQTSLLTSEMLSVRLVRLSWPIAGCKKSLSNSGLTSLSVQCASPGPLPQVSAQTSLLTSSTALCFRSFYNMVLGMSDVHIGADYQCTFFKSCTAHFGAMHSCGPAGKRDYTFA